MTSNDFTSMSAEEVARWCVYGNKIPDATIALMRTQNPSAWLAAIDPDERSRLITPEPPPPIVARQPAADTDQANRPVTLGLLKKTLDALGGGVVEAVRKARAEAKAEADVELKRMAAQLDTASARIGVSLMQLEALNKHHDLLFQRTIQLHDRVRALEAELAINVGVK